MANYTLHINFTAENDEEAIEGARYLVEFAEDSADAARTFEDPVEFDVAEGEWDVSGVDEAGHLDWSVIIPRKGRKNG